MADTAAHMAFEGPEKTLEVWFKNDNSPTCSLRSVPEEKWVPMLDLVNCKILSSTSNEHCTAFLLSESSCFIYDSMLILKTCGTTTLLLAVGMMIDIAKTVGLDEIENVFYSRQNFFFPSHQLEPHKTFKDETKFLTDTFGAGGSPLMLGNISGNHYKYFNWENPNRAPSELEDITYEILMTGLDEKSMKRYFYKRENEKVQEAGHESGIYKLLEGLGDEDDYKNIKYDEFIFDPFGYSMNALLGKNYYTIHVTPQDVCSYASFETNLNQHTYTELTTRLLNIFKPTQFMIVIVDTPADRGWKRLPILTNYTRRERCEYDLNTYSVTYASYQTNLKESIIKTTSEQSEKKDNDDGSGCAVI